MKKTLMTIAIVLGLGLATFANPNGGLFQRGNTPEDNHFLGRTSSGETPLLPAHNQVNNQDADPVPVGSGIAVLVGLGAAYLVGKKRREA